MTLVFSREGVEVARARTGSAGGYAVALDAGRYTVSAARRRQAGKGIVRHPLAVIEGRLVQRRLGFDVGIR